MEKPYVKRSDRIRAIGDVPQDLAAALCDNNFRAMPCPQPGEWLAIQKEPGQPYSAYIGQEHTCRGKISIQPLDRIRAADMELFFMFASAFFQGTPVEVLPGIPIESLDVDNRENYFGIQYHAGQIRKKICNPQGSHCMLAITLKDLYPRESWNFVYGLAGAETGVFSFIRHRPTDLPDEEAHEIMLYRGCITMVHEIGHMFGLKHCIYYKCLMNGNNGDETWPGYLCPVCLRKLQSTLKFNFASRFRALAEVIANRPNRRWQRLLNYYEEMLKRLN